ncbi:hypothetical protein SPFL3102_03013 [Sporomusaceae bacterium FL31]|nr:hypothetical protein SPFL3101_01031 [Sporomusaceae bacterium FL31]GCE35177.1 hypothetical protein SPFL3102_03013 [Sporomusaceae bacterium]
MLQNVLHNLIPVMQNVATALIPLAMLLAFLNTRKPTALRAWLWRGVYTGMTISLIVAAYRLISGLKREVYEGTTLVFALIFELLLLVVCWQAVRNETRQASSEIPGWIVMGSVTTLLLYPGLEFFLFPAELILSATDLVSVDLLVGILSCLLGLALALFTCLAIVRASRILPARVLLGLMTAGFIAIMLQQSIQVVQIMMARRVLPMSKGMMAVMAPLINQQSWFFYFLLFVTLALPLLLYLYRKPTKPEGLNPAQYRKLLMLARRQLRWGAVVIVSMVGIFCLATFGKAYADHQEEIVPAIPVTAEQGEVGIALEMVNDGHLHRYSYRAANGNVVRFIVIKKGGSAYGVGLDACDICGPTGYYERDNQVVCKLCDVIMNKATIGFKGGCNPVPIEYKVSGGKIVIPADTLEKEQDRFR